MAPDLVVPVPSRGPFLKVQTFKHRIVSEFLPDCQHRLLCLSLLLPLRLFHPALLLQRSVIRKEVQLLISAFTSTFVSGIMWFTDSVILRTSRSGLTVRS